MNRTNEDKQIIGLVLAGGRSSRMGQDKALLTIEASTMIQRAKRTLRDTSVDKVVVSRNDGNKGHLADLIPNKGPLSGIHSIAMRFPLHNILVMPVDLPLITAETLALLITCAKQSGSNACFEKHNLPLFIHNTPRFRQVIDYTLRCTQCFSVGRLSSHFPVIKLKPQTQSRLFNTNTPEQWRFVMQHFGADDHQQFKEVAHESFK